MIMLAKKEKRGFADLTLDCLFPSRCSGVMCELSFCFAHAQGKEECHHIVFGFILRSSARQRSQQQPRQVQRDKNKTCAHNPVELVKRKKLTR